MTTSSDTDLPSSFIPTYDPFNPEKTILINGLATHMKYIWQSRLNDATHFIHSDPVLHNELRRCFCSFTVESLQRLGRVLETCSGEYDNYAKADGTEWIRLRVPERVLWMTPDAFSWWIEQFRIGNVTDFWLLGHIESPVDEKDVEVESDETQSGEMESDATESKGGRG